MAIGLLILLVASVSGVVVDASGHVQVDPGEQAREARGIELLRDANEYYNTGGSPSFQSDVAIQKYETVLADVELLPQLRQDVTIKLAGLYRSQGDLSRWHRSAGDTEYIAGTADLKRALSYYNELLEDEFTVQRPALCADTLLAMGEIEANLSHFEEAVKHNKRAQLLAEDASESPDPMWTARHRDNVKAIARTNTMNVIQRDRNDRAHAREKGALNPGIADLTRFLSTLDPGKGEAAGATNAPKSGLNAGREGDRSLSSAGQPRKAAVLFGAGLAISTVGAIVAMRKVLQQDRGKNRYALRPDERSK